MLTKMRRFLSKFTISSKDVVMSATSGWGPGGQSVNKTMNCVQMTHIPTGIQVKVHDSREKLTNEKIAFKRLTDKVDLHLNGENSKLSKKFEKMRRNKDRLRRKRLAREKDAQSSYEPEGEENSDNLK